MARFRKKMLVLAVCCGMLLLGACSPVQENSTTTQSTTATTLSTTTQPTTVTTQPTTKPRPVANPYGPEDFEYDGQFLVCTAGQSKIGIDVSAHQGEINWTKVKDAGVEFVLVRIGYRGYGNGALMEDTYARVNLENARAAGLQVGGYFFSQAINAQEAKEEAAFALEILDGFRLDLPLVYDWEYISDTARTAEVTTEVLTACVHGFCGQVEDAGYQSMVYFNDKYAAGRLDIQQIGEYPFWLAMYTDEMTFPYQVQCWQYSNEGRVSGIYGNVDLNVWIA